MNSRLILQYSLLAGSVYFFSISIAHFFEFKIPVVFIYYDVTSYEYQNKIISALAFGWAAFFYLGFCLCKINLFRLTGFPIFSGLFAIIVLSWVNFSGATELKSLNGGGSLFPYWISTTLLFVYWIWVFSFYLISNSKKND